MIRLGRPRRLCYNALMPTKSLAQTPANVLLICCDHLRADWLGCNGHPLVQTPQIDKIAYGGVNFQSAFSECPVCVPARRILMTGLGPYGIRMNRNVDAQPFVQGPKLAELMTRAGYQTFASGKMHTAPARNRLGFEDIALNEEGRRQGGLRKDDYEAWLEEKGLLHIAWSHGLGNNEYGLRLNPLPEPMTTTHWTAQRAMQFIQRRDPTRPFFLYVSFDKPHPPIVPPASYYELYRDAEFPAPVMGEWLANKLPTRIRATRNANHYEDLARNPAVLQQSLRGFAAMITHIDSMIGQLVGTLREEKVWDDTWVIFTSDHGDQLFEHGHFAKGDFFRGSTNVPLIVRPSNRWRAEHRFRGGRVNRTAPVGLADIMPTILDIAGIKIPRSVEGQSLASFARTERPRFRRFTFGNCTDVYGVSDGRFKYQWFGGDNLEFLFDTHDDPLECRDLAGSASHRGTLQRLRSALIRWMSAHNDPHVKAGRLKPIPSPPERLAEGKAVNNWNNRGRH
jgi:arylsulfatase